MAILLGTGIVNPALRIAAITGRPMRVPSLDQSTEAIGILNRMIGNWNTDPLKIFSTAISAYPLVAGQKTYTIGGPGLGANFDAAAPQRITFANIIVTPASGAVYRRKLHIVTDQQWSDIAVQDIPGTIPTKLFSDCGFPLTSLSLRGQPLANYQLELYTWQLIAAFAAVTDAVIVPPGYEEALVYNLAKRIAAQYPLESKITQQALDLAVSSLADIESKNAPAPILKVDGAIRSAGGRRGGGWSHLTNQ